MEKNIGRTDSLIRIAAAAAIFYFLDYSSIEIQPFLGIYAAGLIFSALNRVSLVYVPFKFSTAKKSIDIK